MSLLPSIETIRKQLARENAPPCKPEFKRHTDEDVLDWSRLAEGNCPKCGGRLQERKEKAFCHMPSKHKKDFRIRMHKLRILRRRMALQNEKDAQKSFMRSIANDLDATQQSY